MKIIDYDNITEVGAFNDSLWNGANLNQSPGVNSPQIPASSITNLNAFITDVNSGLIWGIRWWANNLVWSSSAYNSITYTSWTLTLSNGSSYSITGDTKTLTTVTYIFLDTAVSTTTLQTTTIASNSVWGTRILVCVANITVSWKKAEFQVFWGKGNNTFITADNIAANTITVNEVNVNSAFANEVFSNTITATGTITGWNFQTAASNRRILISWSANKMLAYNDSWTEVMNIGYNSWWFNNLIYWLVWADWYTWPLIYMEGARDSNTARFISNHTTSALPTISSECYSANTSAGTFTNYSTWYWLISQNNSTTNPTVYISNSNASSDKPSLTVANWVTSLSGKLKIPVWSNLY